MKYIFLIILIIASIGVFVAVILPRYAVIKTSRTDIAAFNANLATAGRLQQSRDALVAQYNNIQKTDLDGIKTLLPDSVDNIRLIIQLDSLATKNGLSSLRNVTYSPDQIPTVKTPVTPIAGPAGAGGAAPAVVAPMGPMANGTVDPASAQRTYGQFVISFQTSGQYSNFLSFLSDLEQNLRLVDVTDVTFTPVSDGSGGAQTAASSLTYKVTLKTYWLKQ
jgi:hypothetical protein